MALTFKHVFHKNIFSIRKTRRWILHRKQGLCVVRFIRIKNTVRVNEAETLVLDNVVYIFIVKTEWEKLHNVFPEIWHTINLHGARTVGYAKENVNWLKLCRKEYRSSGISRCVNG